MVADAHACDCVALGLVPALLQKLSATVERLPPLFCWQVTERVCVWVPPEQVPQVPQPPVTHE